MANKKRSSKANFLEGLFLDKYPAQSRFSESFRSLRTNLHFSFAKDEFHSILITSSEPSEGKTTIAANLCYVLSQAGNKVIMIDADLRKPKLSNLSHSQNNHGLTNLLIDPFNIDIESGSLQEFGFSDLFWLHLFQKKTGVLHLSGGDEKIDIFFLKGNLWDVNLVTRPRDKMLAKLLVESNFVTNEQVQQVLEYQINTKQKLGFILINMGYVKEENLTGFITLHMMEGLRKALQMKSGKFSFESLNEYFFQRPSFNPVNLPELYHQAVVGEEELPYLEKEIFSFIEDTGVENLFLLPSGDLPPEPTALLESGQMSFLLSFLKKRFDFLIIDSPPIIPASDALILAPFTDGVLLVSRSRKGNRELAKKAVEQLRMAQAKLLGVVLNQLDLKKEGYYKYYSKYYGKSS